MRYILNVNMETFETLMKGTFTFNQEDYNNNPGWKILCNLYDRNFLAAEKSISKLPKIIHQIWLGSEFPIKYNKWVDSWQRLNPSWDYKLWTDKDLEESQVHISNWGLFNLIKNMGQKSDYLRYHILNQFGGLYIDTDFECLQSFDSLSYAEFLVGITYDSAPIINNALIGSIPNHPILQKAINIISTIQKSSISKDIMNATGPYFFTRTFFSVVQDYMKGVVVLPPGYFYPFPNERGFEDKRKNGKDYVRDYSYAIHYWDVSWMKNRK